MSSEEKVLAWRDIPAVSGVCREVYDLADAAIAALEAEVEALKVGGTCRWWQSRSDADGCYLCVHPDLGAITTFWCGPGCKCSFDPSGWTPRADIGGGT